MAPGESLREVATAARAAMAVSITVPPTKDLAQEAEAVAEEAEAVLLSSTLERSRTVVPSTLLVGPEGPVVCSDRTVAVTLVSMVVLAATAVPVSSSFGRRK